MSSPKQRQQNYEYRMNPERIAADFEARRQPMIDRFARRMTEMYDIEERVKEVLATEKGMRTTMNFFYHAFARQVYAQQLVVRGGEELNAEVQTLIELWQGRGLKESVLMRIRDEVFSIPAG